MKITKQTIEEFKERLDAYIIIEEPFKQNLTPETYLLDILYFLGISIDEKKYFAAQGFEAFKKELQRVAITK